MSAAMSTDHGGERRKELRIPTELPTTVFMGRHRKEAIVHDLSVGGAYLATDHPFLEGSRLHIEIPLERGVVHCKGRVVKANTADQPIRPDVPDGMGVSFEQLTANDAEAVRATMLSFLRRFRL